MNNDAFLEMTKMINTTLQVKIMTQQEYDLLDESEKSIGDLYCVVNDCGSITNQLIHDGVKDHRIEGCSNKDSRNELPINCKNCGAILPKRSVSKYELCICEYCGTVYN